MRPENRGDNTPDGCEWARRGRGGYGATFTTNLIIDVVIFYLDFFFTSGFLAEWATNNRKKKQIGEIKGTTRHRVKSTFSVCIIVYVQVEVGGWCGVACVCMCVCMCVVAVSI